MLSIETSIGLAFDTIINDVIVVGNFNLDMQTPTLSRKIETLCQMYNSPISFLSLHISQKHHLH